MESHNPRSYTEPYQGATTGVGGILRDVFTMGARPIACLDALSFGAPTHPQTRHLLGGVVSGIGGYGQFAGMPIVYLGSKTGRDGIHGATMASAEFGAGTEEKRPTVQVGDPFAEKLLLAAR